MGNISFDIFESDKIKGVFFLKPSVSTDFRGNIWTSYVKDQINNMLPKNINFNHDKFSYSKKYVLRGIHWDNKTWKLVTCVYGEIYQVVVDCREHSRSFLVWEGVTIKAKDPLLVLIPPGIGNSYLVLSEEAVYHYKLGYKGAYFDADKQFTLKWNDPRVNIKWPIENPILSDRDR